MIVPSAQLVRSWSDELLNDHLQNCLPSSGYMCSGCTQLNRREFERESVAAGVVIAAVAEGWI